MDRIWPLPIPFNCQQKSSKDDTAESDKKDKCVEFEVSFAAPAPMITTRKKDETSPPSDTKDKYTIKVQKFKDGTPEEWVKHVIAVDGLLLQVGWTGNYKQSHSVWRAATVGKANKLLQFWHRKHMQENQ